MLWWWFIKGFTFNTHFWYSDDGLYLINPFGGNKSLTTEEESWLNPQQESELVFDIYRWWKEITKCQPVKYLPRPSSASTHPLFTQYKMNVPSEFSHRAMELINSVCGLNPIHHFEWTARGYTASPNRKDERMTMWGWKGEGRATYRRSSDTVTDV